MANNEIVAEIRAAAASLVTAAGAAENGDFVAAEIRIEDALFRAQSLLSRIRQVPSSDQVQSRTPPGDAGEIKS